MVRLIGLVANVLLASLAWSSPQPMTVINGRSLEDQSLQSISIGERKALVVVFLSSRCPCSNSHVGEMKSLAQDFPNVAFVAVHANDDEPEKEAAAYFKSAGLPFAVLQDEQSQLANRFRALKTPHAFVIAKNGEVVYRGGVSASRSFASGSRKYLREALTDIENNRPVRTPEARTLGCVIARRK